MQFKINQIKSNRETENLKTIVLSFWAESGKGTQEKIFQHEQSGAFARLVVSVARLKIIQQPSVYIHFFSVIRTSKQISKRLL